MNGDETMTLWIIGMFVVIVVLWLLSDY